MEAAGVLSVTSFAALWFFFVDGLRVDRFVIALLPRPVGEPLRARAVAASQFPKKPEERRAVRAIAGVSSRDTALQDGKKDCRGEAEAAIQFPDAIPSAGACGGSDSFPYELKCRCAGFLHAIVAVPLALWALRDPRLSVDKVTSRTFRWTAAGGFSAGYFLWDLIVVCTCPTFSPEWFLHAIICLGAIGSSVVCDFAPLSYYGALFLILEASTPFLALRWLALKSLPENGKGGQVHTAWGVTNGDGANSRKTSGPAVAVATTGGGGGADAAVFKVTGYVTAPDSATPRKSVSQEADKVQHRLPCAVKAPQRMLGPTDETAVAKRLASAAGLIFALLFVYLRLVWQVPRLLWPLERTFFDDVRIRHGMWAPRWWFYVAAIPAFYALNVYWVWCIAGVAVRSKTAESRAAATTARVLVRGEAPNAAGDPAAAELRSGFGTVQTGAD